ncbi:jacalin-related lectin 3-like [Humulus lupulus]|uniref:jacalin-related lectin 3-like n=1 Tax=Humulus lupulus TaxID=3486 RepID=UPI002B40093F|nr:jacalin-related lectin 3-like [Humulus lupulus]
MSYLEGNEKSNKSGGPWGGECGGRWDDGVYCSVRQIIISHGAVIDSIQIEYDTRGCSLWSEKHGGSGGVKTDKVKLDYPDEYLISISGYFGSVSDCGPVVIRSLAFETNKRRFGPYGFQKGTHFSFSLTGAKIVGFHGRTTGLHLDAIGVYVKPFLNIRTVQTQTAQNRTGLGAGGGGGNKAFDIMVAVREKMDNMFISDGGFIGKNEQAFATGHEGVKGSGYHRQVGKEKENYMIMPPNHTYSEETEHYSNDHSGFYGHNESPMKGYPAHMGRPVKEFDHYNMDANHDRRRYSEYEAKEKVYGAKGRPNPKYSIDDDQGYALPPERGIYREYETKETKLYGGGSGAEKDYANMRRTEGLFGQNRDFSDYEITKEKLYQSSAQIPNRPQGVKQAVSYGPWGGTGGMLFDDGVYTGVREIHIARSGGVVSIKVCYDMNGRAVWGNKNGGNGGFRLDKIAFDYPHEYLTHISGYYGSLILRGPTVIKSLTFFTNKKKYGPFGDEQGLPFSSGQKDGIVVGFHGKQGWFVDSIGVHVLNVVEGKYSLPRPSFDINSTVTDIRYGHDQVVSTPVKVPIPLGQGLRPAMISGPTGACGSGPWGGDGGKPWDDGVFTGIRKIFLTKGEAILSIQIEYDRNGQSMWSVKHGNNNDGSCHVIQFEYPHEVLTGMSGYYGPVMGDACKIVVKSLTFYTNRGRYGPFGEEMGTYFTSPRNEGKIVGFHGKSGSHLYAIGAHMQPWYQDRSAEQGPIKMILNKIFA